MSLAAVRKALARIVIETPVPSTARGLARSFTHATESGDRDKPADGRRFYFIVDSMAARGPYTPGGPHNRRVDAMRLVITYPDDVADSVIEDAVSADYDAIAGRLLNSALWAGTPVVDVVVFGDTLLPATLTRDDGGLSLTIALTVEHTR